jgi:hypothetical protein
MCDSDVRMTDVQISPCANAPCLEDGLADLWPVVLIPGGRIRVSDGRLRVYNDLKSNGAESQKVAFCVPAPMHTSRL